MHMYGNATHTRVRDPACVRGSDRKEQGPCDLLVRDEVRCLGASKGLCGRRGAGVQ